MAEPTHLTAFVCLIALVVIVVGYTSKPKVAKNVQISPSCVFNESKLCSASSITGLLCKISFGLLCACISI